MEEAPELMHRRSSKKGESSHNSTTKEDSESLLDMEDLNVSKEQEEERRKVEESRLRYATAFGSKYKRLWVGGMFCL